MKTSIILLLCGLFAASVFADNSNSDDGKFDNDTLYISKSLVKYPYIHYYDTVYTDTTRNRDGSKYLGGTPVNGYRLIDVRIYQPATGPGSGPPIKYSFVPSVFNGTYPNQPLVTSTRSLQSLRSWTDNIAAPGTFPLIVMFGGGGLSSATLRIAEHIAAAGYIVVVPSGHGSDTSVCPASICTTAVSRTQFRDGRIVLNAAENGLLGFNVNQVLKDNNGKLIAGCAGGSLGAALCEQIAAGTSTLNANSIPGENSADLRIKAVWAGDIYNPPTAAVNTDHFQAALAMYNSGQFENWPRDFGFYHNASKRIYYEVTNAEHAMSGVGTLNTCDGVKEFIRVYRDGVNTPLDDANVPNEMSVYFAYCPSNYLKGFNVLPAASTFPSTLAALLPSVPLAGFSVASVNDGYNVMLRYYIINFFDAIIKNESASLARASTASFPGFIDNVYVDSVPGIKENDFNLQNTVIDFKPVGNNYKTTITTRSGEIADPSTTPLAYSLFGSNSWDDDLAIIAPAFNFPIKSGNIRSSNSIAVSANGYIFPESSMASFDGIFAAKRLGQWFADRGSWSIAVLGTDLAGGPGGPEGQIWVSSTPERLRITWYKVYSYEFPDLPGVSAQVTLFPDGSIRLEYDNSIPAPGVLLGEQGESASIVVGISNGRLHVTGGGKYNPAINAKIANFTDIMSGKSKDAAQAVFEVYTQGVQAQQR